MQKEKAKREPRTRPRAIVFVGGWVLIWWLVWLAFTALDIFMTPFLLSLNDVIGFFLRKAVFFAALSTLQALWVRRQFRSQLRHWIPLSLLGALAGTAAFLVVDSYVLPPYLSMYYIELWSLSVPEAARIMRLKQVAEYLAEGTLLWSLPVAFQWAALRKHYRRHALWLLAALAHNPFATSRIIQFFKLPRAAEVQRELGISYSYLPEPPIASLLLDLTIPCLVTGLALYWILSRKQNTESAH